MPQCGHSKEQTITSRKCGILVRIILVSPYIPFTPFSKHTSASSRTHVHFSECARLRMCQAECHVNANCLRERRRGNCRRVRCHCNLPHGKCLELLSLILRYPPLSIRRGLVMVWDFQAVTLVIIELLRRTEQESGCAEGKRTFFMHFMQRLSSVKASCASAFSSITPVGGRSSGSPIERFVAAMPLSRTIASIISKNASKHLIRFTLTGPCSSIRSL